ALRLIPLLHDHADHLPRPDGLTRRYRELGDDAVAVGADLVLHLHRLDDAEDLAGPDLASVGDADFEHGSLHRADDGVARRAVAAGRTPALATAAGKLGVW